MNNFISKAALEARRSRYKKGARVELVSMTDPYTKLKPGDLGTVDFVDDAGTVFIIWNSGSLLGAVHGEDEIRLLPSAITDTVKEQLGDGYTFVKAYNAFENGELRIIAMDERGFEHRYILVDGKLTEKP